MVSVFGYFQELFQFNLAITVGFFLICALDKVYSNVYVYLMRPPLFQSFIQIIDESILCVHGGLSPQVKTLDQVIFHYT